MPELPEVERARALTGERVAGVRRVGKQLMVDTTGPVLGPHPLRPGPQGRHLPP